METRCSLQCAASFCPFLLPPPCEPGATFSPATAHSMCADYILRRWTRPCLSKAKQLPWINNLFWVQTFFLPRFCPLNCTTLGSPLGHQIATVGLLLLPLPQGLLRNISSSSLASHFIFSFSFSFYWKQILVVLQYILTMVSFLPVTPYLPSHSGPLPFYLLLEKNRLPRDDNNKNYNKIIR